MRSRGALEKLIRALPASFIKREVLDALLVLQRSNFIPDGLHPGGLSTLHRSEFSPERLHPGGEGLHSASQGFHSDIGGNVVVGILQRERLAKLPGHVITVNPVIPYRNFY